MLSAFKTKVNDIGKKKFKVDIDDNVNWKIQRGNNWPNFNLILTMSGGVAPRPDTLKFARKIIPLAF